MNQLERKTGIIAVVAFLMLTACSGGGGGGTTNQIPALRSPDGMSNAEASAKNNEGTDHLVQGHYDVSKPLFEAAIATKDNFAEAHFNLGVTLDGMGDHPGATAAFQKAMELGKDNPKISGSELMKKHLGM
ncbi:MAG: tetratricopeptide repeat protein [Nitrospirota bacterium]